MNRVNAIRYATIFSILGVSVSNFFVSAADLGIAPSSAMRFKKLKYVCHPTAMKPENNDRYSSGTKANMKAVTAGHSLHELMTLTGTVFFTRSQICAALSPASNACMPKKYVLKTGVKHIWLTATLVTSERIREE